MPDAFIVNRINVSTVQPNSANDLFAYIVGTYWNGSARIPRLFIYKYNGTNWSAIIMENDNSGYGFITPTRTAITTSPSYNNSIYLEKRFLGKNDVSLGVATLSSYSSANNHQIFML